MAFLFTEELQMKIIRMVVMTGAGVTAAASSSLFAADLFGPYVGGGIGRSQVSENAYNPTIGNPHFGEFEDNHTAFQLMAGLRPISLVGAELAYVDLGSPSGKIFNYSAEASMKGATAFGVLYIPVPVIDVYAKLGVARVHSSLSGFYPNGGLLECLFPCNTTYFRQDRTNTGLAEGGGAQYKFGSWTVRADYERFNAAGEHPRVVTIGLTWTFL